jgi:hypothetical protein
MAVKFKNNIDMEGYRVTDLADPNADQDAATRAYVLAQIAAAGGYTDENARDAIGSALVAGNNIDITVNDAGDTITIDVEPLTVGDISGLGTLASLNSVGTANITDDSVTYAKLQNITAASRIIGRGASGGAGDPQELTVGGGVEISGTTIQTSAFTGDVTKTAGGTATTIATGAVTNAKMANMANATVKGRNTAGTGAPEDVTMTQLKTLLALTASDISNFNTAADARVTAVVNAAFINALSGVDADTLGGSNKAQVVAEAIAGVVDSAPATLDTLNELAAALGDDPNFATTITNLINARMRRHAENCGTTATHTVTHNFNTLDVIVQVVEVSTGETVFVDVVRTGVNAVNVVFGSAPTAGQYRIIVMG